jgi:hypothetical protein
MNLITSLDRTHGLLHNVGFHFLPGGVNEKDGCFPDKPYALSNDLALDSGVLYVVVSEAGFIH